MAEEIHVGKGSRKSKAPRWQFVIALVVIAVLAVGAGIYVSWVQNKDDQQQDSGLPPEPESVSATREQFAAGDIGSAEKTIDEALADPSTSDEEKYKLYLEKGRIAQQKQDFQGAVDAFTKAYEIEQTFDAARRLGSAYQEIGNKAKAIEFYKKAVELNPKNNPTYESDNNTLQMMIDALEAEQ